MVQERPSVKHHHSHTQHRYNSGNPIAMRRTAWATLISLLMMVGEITAGYITGSMALLADGWHMATHVLALGLSWLAFVFSARLADDERFAFGTGKLEVLASFVSALLLLAVGLWMGLESVARLLAPTEVRFMDAMVVAVIGLWVNLVCALLLHQKVGGHAHVGGHSHGHAHSHGHPHAHQHDHAHQHSHAHLDGHDHPTEAAPKVENLNLKAAYLHVLADALTSILAIVALLFGQVTGLPQVDSLMGLVGAVMVVVWARGLLSQSAWLLLDAQAPESLRRQVGELVNQQAPSARIAELKLWQIASGRYACNLVLSDADIDAGQLREALLASGFIAHLVLEIESPAPQVLP